jgi:hypothetical protein
MLFSWLRRFVLPLNRSARLKRRGAPGRRSSLWLEPLEDRLALSGAASTFSLTGFPSPITAGVAGNFTVTARDSGGNVATSYTGTVHFTHYLAGLLPADYTFTAADQGVHTFSATQFQAGVQSLTVTDVNNSAIWGTETGIIVNAAPAVSLLVSGPGVTSPGTGTYLSVTAVDPYGNTASGYTGTIHFTSSDAAATLPPDYTFTANDGGQHLFYGTLTLQTLGNQTVTATDTATASLTGTGAVAVMNPIPGLHLVLAPSVTTTAAGTSFGITVTALDGNNNVATGYYGTVQFSSSDHGSGVVLPAAYTFTPADNGTHTFSNGFTLVTAGNQSITVTDNLGGVSGGGGDWASTTLTVTPGTVSTLRLSGFPAGVTAGSGATFTVSARDAYGNIATGYGGTIHFSSSDAQAGLPADVVLSGGAGTFTALLKTAGYQSVTVADTTTAWLTSTYSGINVTPAAATVLQVAGFPASITAGLAGTGTVTALDAYGNIATGYSGTVHFTSSDAQAVVPANATLKSGQGTFSATFKTAGVQSLVATDTVNGALTGTESGISVSPAAASSLTLAGFPSPTTAGTAGNFTVTAHDAFGNIATGYAGTVRFLSSDPAALLPANYVFTAADAGSHVFTATFTKAGNQSLTVVDTNATVSGSTQAGIVVNPGAATHLSVTSQATTTAGYVITLGVQALDGYGNTATGYSGTVHFSSNDAQAVLPTDYTFTAADAGIHLFNITLKTAGSTSVTATDVNAPGITGTRAGIAVNPAAGASLSVTGFPATVTAGTAFNLTVTVRDASGNVATFYNGTVSFTSSDAQAILPGSYTFNYLDQGVHTFTVWLKTAGSQTITVKDTTSGFSTQAGITVNTAAASSFLVAGFPSSTTAGVAHTFTVTVQDAYGNTVTGYGGTVHFSSSDAQAVLPANYTFTASDQGVHTFTATLKTAGPQSLTLADVAAPISGGFFNLTVTAAAATHFAISAPSSVSAGVAFNVTVTALDAYGNVANGYTGSVHFSTTSRRATLPADYTFVSGDNGVHAFSVILRTSGTQTLTVTDKGNSSLTGSATVRVG